MSTDSIPRRIRLDKMYPIEKMITEAKWELEKVGADVRLTEATILLSKAKDLISDFLDEKEKTNELAYTSNQ